MNNNTLSTIDNKNKNVLIFIILLFCFFSNHIQAAEKLIWQSKFDYVAIVPIDDADYNGNDHPAKLSSQNVYDALSSIRLTEENKGFFNIDVFNMFSDDTENESSSESKNEGNLKRPYDALFNKVELHKISIPISKALMKANHGEDVIFSVTGKHGNTLGKSDLTTTARLFYKDKQLHIIFGEIYVDIKKKYRRSGGTSTVPEIVEARDLKEFRLKTGAREKQSKLPVNFITDRSHVLSQYKGKTREDWLTIDMPVLISELEKNKKHMQRKESIVDETDELQLQTEKIDREQEQLKQKVEHLEKIVRSKEKAQITQEIEPEPMPTKKPEKNLEDRLLELKKLHDKGIISDDIYNEKAKMLLKEL